MHGLKFIFTKFGLRKYAPVLKVTPGLGVRYIQQTNNNREMSHDLFGNVFDFNFKFKFQYK